MDKNVVGEYRCPVTGTELTLLDPVADGCHVLEGKLVSETGTVFPIRGGVPDFTWPKELIGTDAEARDYYEASAEDYDRYAYLTYKTYDENEEQVIDHMVDKLRLTPDSTILEVGCGTGRSSVRIASRLSKAGKLFLQELSPKCLALAMDKLKSHEVPMEFAVANGCYLPLPDNSVDATYHFGGLNVFSDIGRALGEMARVTKVGGRIVVSDENMPVWLRQTEFAKIMMNSNPLLKYDVPIEHIPVCARQVKVEWILGGVFYLIHFTVGDGPPTANIDFEIPTLRGGTHRTRYYGNLEGVSPEVKELAQQAHRKVGTSMANWLDEVVRTAARRDLGEGEDE